MIRLARILFLVNCTAECLYMIRTNGYLMDPIVEAGRRIAAGHAARVATRVLGRGISVAFLALGAYQAGKTVYEYVRQPGYGGKISALDDDLTALADAERWIGTDEYRVNQVSRIYNDAIHVLGRRRIFRTPCPSYERTQGSKPNAEYHLDPLAEIVEGPVVEPHTGRAKLLIVDAVSALSSLHSDLSRQSIDERALLVERLLGVEQMLPQYHMPGASYEEHQHALFAISRDISSMIPGYEKALHEIRAESTRRAVACGLRGAAAFIAGPLTNQKSG